MRKIKISSNQKFALLFGLLMILCCLSIFLNRGTAEVFEAVDNVDNEGEAETAEPYNKADDNLTEDQTAAETNEAEKADVYDLTGYIYKNSREYMNRLKSEINDLANDTCDKDSLYVLAEGIRRNQLSYYTMLNESYEEGAFELVEGCKSYAFNVEAMAANIMKFIEVGRTKYISRAMICISADSKLSSDFLSAQSNFAAAREAALAAAAEQTEEAAPSETKSLELPH